MKTTSVEKMIAYLCLNEKHMTEWYIKFVDDLKGQLTKGRSVTDKQFDYLFKETRRVFFINNISQFEE